MSESKKPEKIDPPGEKPVRLHQVHLKSRTTDKEFVYSFFVEEGIVCVQPELAGIAPGPAAMSCAYDNERFYFVGEKLFVSAKWLAGERPEFATLLDDISKTALEKEKEFNSNETLPSCS